MFKLSLIGAGLVVVLLMTAYDRIAMSDLRWLIMPPPAANTFGASR